MRRWWADRKRDKERRKLDEALHNMTEIRDTFGRLLREKRDPLGEEIPYSKEELLTHLNELDEAIRRPEKERWELR
jgi:hypothetical protein